MPLSLLDRVMRDFLLPGSFVGQPPCEDCLRLLLEGRVNYQDRPDPTHWRTGEVRSMLLDMAPSRLTEVCDLPNHALPAVRSYLQFLEASEYLHPGSTSGTLLLRELDRVAAVYPAAMAGQPSQPNAGPLAAEPVQADPVDHTPESFPPVTLADDATLAHRARLSAKMREIWEVADFVAPHRRVDKYGNLIPKDTAAIIKSLGIPVHVPGTPKFKDVPEIKIPFWLALETEVLVLRRGGVFAGPRFETWAAIWRDHSGSDDDVLEIWEDLFRRFVEHTSGPLAAAAVTRKLHGLASIGTPQILAILYGNDEGQDAQSIIRETIQELSTGAQQNPGDAELVEGALGSVLGADLIDLARHGALELSGLGLLSFQERFHSLHEGSAEALRGMLLFTTPGVLVRLSPLGTWAVRRAFVRSGAQAPVLPSAASPALSGSTAP